MTRQRLRRWRLRQSDVKRKSANIITCSVDFRLPILNFESRLIAQLALNLPERLIYQNSSIIILYGKIRIDTANRYTVCGLSGFHKDIAAQSNGLIARNIATSPGKENSADQHNDLWRRFPGM